jgi:hypothetical protein
LFQLRLLHKIPGIVQREIRAAFIPLRREVRAMRLRLSGLSKNFSFLNRLAKEQLAKVPKKGLKATPEELKHLAFPLIGYGDSEESWAYS